MLNQGSQPLWINPIDASLGTPWVRVAHPHVGSERAQINCFQVHCPTDTTAARLAVTALSDASLDPAGGIVTATSSVLDLGGAALDQAVAASREMRSVRNRSGAFVLPKGVAGRTKSVAAPRPWPLNIPRMAPRDRRGCAAFAVG